MRLSAPNPALARAVAGGWVRIARALPGADPAIFADVYLRLSRSYAGGDIVAAFASEYSRVRTTLEYTRRRGAETPLFSTFAHGMDKPADE